MNILVLGGTQFVSRALATELIARGHDVSILTRGRRSVSYEGIKQHFIADRRDLESLRQLQDCRFDAVFDVSGYCPDDVRGVLGALRLDDRTKYVFLSSGAVYLPSEAPVVEEAPKGKNENWGAYGLDKLEAEELLVRSQPERGYSLSIVRPAYVYGPGNNLYREAYLFDRILRRQPVPIPDGCAKTQFVFIADLVAMLIDLLQIDAGKIEAFNYTNPEPIDWETLVRTAACAAGVEPRIKKVAYRGRMEARDFFPFRDCTYLLDTGKAERFGLVPPKTSLREGLEQSYAWYRKQRPKLFDGKMAKIEAALLL